MASTSVSVTMAVEQAALFRWFIAVDLPRILKGWGPLPAVIATEGQTGAWAVPGSSRTMRLADGTSAFESVTECETPRRFAYRVRDFTHPLIGALAKDAEGEWLFEPASGPAPATKVTWSYTYNPRSALAAVPLALIVRLMWRSYMRVGLEAMRPLVETEA